MHVGRGFLIDIKSIKVIRPSAPCKLRLYYLLVLIKSPDYCEAGYYMKADSTCEQCPVNTFSIAGDTDCTPCPEGMTSEMQSVSSADCVLSE